MPEFTKILYCSKCKTRLTPNEIRYYGDTTETSRCDACRTVNRRSREDRLHSFIKLLVPNVQRKGRLFYDNLTVTALNDLVGTSWIATALIYGYVTEAHDFTIRNGVVNYRQGNRFVQQRVSRYARRFILPEFIGELVTDADLERFNNTITTATTHVRPEFTIVSGETIREKYHQRNYATRQGTLAYSCMRYEDAQKYLDIYVKNPDVCQLLVTHDNEGKVSGRALLWTDVNGVKYMDVVYANDLMAEEFRLYANEQNYQTINNNVVVQLSDWAVKYLPSMDSMTAIDPMTGKLLSRPRWNERGDYILGASTTGQLVTSGTIQRSVCTACNENYQFRAASWDSTFCMGCGHKEAVGVPAGV